MSHQIHILLPEGDLKILKSYSQKEKRSVAELIRQAVKKVYGPVEPTRRQEAFQRLSQRNDLPMEDWKEVKKSLLNRYD